MFNKKLFVLVLSILTIISICLVQTNPTQMKQDKTVNMTTKVAEPTNLIQHNSINITNNAELASIAQSGNGTNTNPYIIENLLITSCIINNKTRDNIGISIYNTSAYFKITNIKVDGCQTAVNFRFVKHGSIEDSFFNQFLSIQYSGELQFNNLKFTNNFVDGFYFYSVHNFTVRNSNIEAYTYGIKVEKSNYGNLTNNTINGNHHGDNSHTGIELIDSYYFTISDNKCFGCGTGFYLDQANTVNLTNNIAENCVIGIRLESSGANILAHNLVDTTTNDGLELIVSNLNNLTGNTVLNSQRYGVGLFESDNNRLINNTSKGSLLSDYHEGDSKHNVFIGNTFKKGSSQIPIIIDVVSILMVLAVISSLGLIIEYKRYQKETNQQLIHKTFRYYLKHKILKKKRNEKEKVY